MKHILILFALLTMQKVNSFAQSSAEGCQTPLIDSTTLFNLPWFGNNQYLINLVDSVESGGGGGANRFIPNTLRIPVTAWVYHLNNLNDNIQNEIVEQYINRVNQFFINNNSRIRLYLRCAVNHFIDAAYYNGVNGNNYNTMFNTYYNARTLNIHFTNGSDGFARGRFPWDNNPYACYIPTFFTNPFTGNSLNAGLANTLSHEIGHALGLVHTHQGRNQNNNGDCGDCYQESVSRTRKQGGACISTIGKIKCEVNGDALCDTDADPLLRVEVNGTSQVFVTADCLEFNRASPYVNDNWGVAWLPTANNNAIRNIMSYSFAGCRLQLTEMQRGVQYYYALNNGHNAESFYLNEDVDVFENDNFFQNASIINLNSIQLRSFHLVPDQNSNFSGCDVDWVNFTAPCNGVYTFETSPVSGKPEADTRITLFNNGLTQLAQNDNSLPGYVFSRVNITLVAGETYRVRINNMMVNTFGWYNLIIKPAHTLTGPDFICNSGTYSLNNLSGSSSLTWLLSPSGILTPNSGTTSPINLTKLQNGTTTLTATINFCGQNYSLSKTIGVVSLPEMLATYNSPYGSNDVVYESNTQVLNDACTNTLVTVTPYSLPVGYWVDWSVITSSSTINWFPSGNNLEFTFTQPGQTISFEATVHNECGTNTYIYNFRAVSVGSCGGGGQQYRVIVSPNPAPSNLNIKVNVQEMLQYGNNNSAWMQIREIKIYDKFGTLKKRKQYGVGNQEVNIPVVDLPNDIYSIHITNGTHTVIKLILIQR
jgi:hypothetical protein